MEQQFPSSPEVSVVVTLFNEGPNVGDLVRRTTAALDGERFAWGNPESGLRDHPVADAH